MNKYIIFQKLVYVPISVQIGFEIWQVGDIILTTATRQSCLFKTDEKNTWTSLHYQNDLVNIKLLTALQSQGLPSP